MWPTHCLQDGDSTFPPTLTMRDTDTIVKKGLHKWVDAYSAFYDNTKNLKTPLYGILEQNGITHVYVGGIATDFCVSWTAEDAIDLKYKVTLIEDATAGIGIPLPGNKTTIDQAMETMKAKGVKTISTQALLNMACPGTAPAPSQPPSAPVSNSVRAPIMLALFVCLRCIIRVDQAESTRR